MLDIATADPIGEVLGRAAARDYSMFSQLVRHASRNQEDARRLKQRLDDEAAPVISEGEALVLQAPGIAALDRPAPLAEPGSVRLAALVNARLDAEPTAQLAMVLGVVAVVRESGGGP